MYFPHMLRKVDRTHALLFAVVLLNAAGVFGFRFFVTLDGPMHVLHACVLKAEHFGHRYDTPTVRYAVNKGTLDLSDLVLVPLTHVLDPLHAHTAYVAFTLLVLGCGAWWVCRAFGVRNGPLFLWLFPLSLNIALVLGFLTFLVATGLALCAWGWWVERRRITGSTLLGLLLFGIACQATHRAGGVLAGLFMGCYESTAYLSDRSAYAQRWSPIPAFVRRMLFLLIVVGVTIKLGTVVLTTPRVSGFEARTPFSDLLSFRSLLLFDERAEHPYILGAGVLLLFTLGLAVHQRLRGKHAVRSTDTLVLAAMLLLTSSFVLRTPNADMLYMGLRAQWVALVLLVLWAVVSTPRTGTSVALGIGVLLLHLWRTNAVERTMSWSVPDYGRTREVVEHLPPHTVAFPLVLDPDWTHGHLSAYAAAAFPGIFFSPNDHLGFRYAGAYDHDLADHSDGFEHGLNWLEQHVAQRREPVIPRIVIFGKGRAEDAITRSVKAVLARHYNLIWSNGYAEIWQLTGEVAP